MKTVAFRLVASIAALLFAAALDAQEWWYLAPPFRISSALAYDLAHARAVLFGGRRYVIGPFDSPFADTWAFDGSRWTQVRATSAPPSRFGHALAYDIIRGRTVLFGGASATVRAFADTWEYDGANWSQIATATFPPPRAYLALAYDLARRRTVLFGGQLYADTWEYDGTNWTRIATAASPPGRTGHALAYDIGRARTVLFGGEGQVAPSLADTWEYGGTNWTLVATAASPPARSGHALAYDTAIQRTVLFGGWDGTAMVFNDTWEYDGTNWVHVLTFPFTAPPAQTDHSLAHDIVRGRTLLFGGSETWEYSGSNWTRVAAPPPARLYTALAHDAARGRTVLFGGVPFAGPAFADTWEYDGSRWQQIATTAAPSGRWSFALTYDVARARTVLFGGTAAGAVRNFALAETWEYDGTTWIQNATATAPPARSVHALAYDIARARTVLFGGSDVQGTRFSDTWEYDGVRWAQVATAASPSPRGGHGLVYDAARGRTVLFGGGSMAGPLGDTWEYDGSRWNQAATITSPPPRMFLGMTYDTARGRTVLFGGRDSNSSRLDDTWEYDGSNWTQLQATGTPEKREAPALAHDLARGRTVLFGGDDFLPLDDTAELVPAATATWTRHGLGCAGSAGPPALDALPNIVPALGSSFPLRLSSLPSQPGAALLAFGFDIISWHRQMLPLALDAVGLPGCWLWIGPAPGADQLLAHPGGALNHTVAIPADPALAGLVVGVQALVLDVAAPSGIGAVTNGGILRIY